MSNSTLAGAGKDYSKPHSELGGISTGNHVAFAFSDSREKQQRLFQLVSDSLQDPSAAILYIAGKQGAKGIRFSMKDFGIDVGSFERQRRFKIADSEEWFLVQGKNPSFKPISKIAEQFREFGRIEEQAGYYLFTIISETDTLVRKGFFNQYRDLESELGNSISLSSTVFVCAYDQREIDAAGFKNIDLSTMHSFML